MVKPMNKQTYSFQYEPRNDLFHTLIDFAQRKCRFAWLVIRPTINLDGNGEQALQLLNQYLYQTVNAKEWPGTKLLTGTGRLHKYFFSLEFAKEIKSISNGLYDWIQPHLPEDICFMVDENTPWLVSISHERDGYLVLSEQDVQEITSQIPELISILEKT